MIKLSKSAGFTLVELMIVVAIIAILAAIAIPTFLQFQLRAREAEARTNLHSIRVCEEAYAAENDQYLDCADYPAVADLGRTQNDWDRDASGGFVVIGFEPDGKVRYNYAVAALDADAVGTYITDDADDKPHFEAIATGDVDDDDTDVVLAVTRKVSTPRKYPVGGGAETPREY
jgi:type IV pilus assembly protein PilA